MGIRFSYPGNWYLQEFTEGQLEAVILTSFDPTNPLTSGSGRIRRMQFRLLPVGSVSQDLDPHRARVGDWILLFDMPSALDPSPHVPASMRSVEKGHQWQPGFLCIHIMGF